MIAVIGDIHGCFNTLKDLIEKVRSKYENIEIYSVGDLVDRGKFSLNVVEFVKQEKIKFTPGNHDYMFYYFIKQPTSQIARTWLYNGYESTISSYDNNFDKVNDHLNMIAEAPLFINHKDCFISHAGISKYYKGKFPRNFKNNLKDIEEIIVSDLQSERSLLWTRDDLLDIGKLQIVGHTRQDDVVFLKSNNVAYIDTSVYTGNKLSAVIADDNKIVDILSVQTYFEDIN